MRADRLLSLLLLLQRHGRMTAEGLAAQLEVSERTIYRDIDALSSAGVPVYGERGPEGGYSLVDGYRTNLTGLTADEMRAFFMLSIPAPLADLGISQELKGALLKLWAALPVARRDDEDWVRQRFYLDATWWGQGDEPIPHLRAIQQAVWQDRKLQVSYRLPLTIEMEQVVDPYALVAKGGVWYLVCAYGSRVRVHRVSNLQDVRALDSTFQRPAGFDLVAFWQSWCAEYDRMRTSYMVTLRFSPAFIPYLAHYFGEGVRPSVEAAPPEADGWITLRLPFERLEDARARILSFGRGAEVLEPEPLRLSIIDYARQVVELYGSRCW